MAIRSKYFDEARLQSVIDSFEKDYEEYERSQQIDAWMKANPTQAAAVKAELDKLHQPRAVQPAPVPQRSAFPPGTPQNPIPGNAKFSPADLKYDRPGVQRIIDPMAR